MAYYAFQTAFKSGVIGGSWSTPSGTPFFVRWGDVSLKVPMAALREEYEAWEKLRRERHPEPEPEPLRPAPLSSFPSGSFDWADDVEQEFFSSAGDSDSSDASTSNLDSIDLSDPADSDSTSLDDSISSNDSDKTLLGDNDETILDDSDSTSPDSPTPLDEPTPATPSTPANIDTTVYRIINIDTTDTNFSLHMVQDDSASETSDSNTDTDPTDPSATAKELFDTIQLLATAGLFNLDTYATVFDTAARACAAGPPFWLRDPLGDREIVI